MGGFGRKLPDGLVESIVIFGSRSFGCKLHDVLNFLGTKLLGIASHLGSGTLSTNGTSPGMKERSHISLVDGTEVMCMMDEKLKRCEITMWVGRCVDLG